MKRRQTLVLGASLGVSLGTTLALPAPAASAAQTPAGNGKPDKPDKPGERVLRYAFQVAETGFDPAQINDTDRKSVV